MVDQKKLFCVYSQSFGDQRRSVHAKNATTIPGIDHYYITNEDTVVPGWTVIKKDLLPGLNGIPPGRRTSKRWKWGPPAEELKGYRYLLHVDDNAVHNCNKITKEHVERIIDKNPEVFVFHEAHQWRTVPSQEIQAIVNQEASERSGPKDKVVEWQRKIGTSHDDFPLIHTCCFLRRIEGVTDEFTEAFQSIPKLLDQNGLWRDQIVLPIALRDSWRAGRVLIGCPETHATVIQPLLPTVYPPNPYVKALLPGETWIRQKQLVYRRA